MRTLTAALLVFALAAPVQAQDHSGHGAMVSPTDTIATTTYRDANARMHATWTLFLQAMPTPTSSSA